MTRDGSNRSIPQLAESWRLIDDTLWEFKLRRGVRFHNGHRLTATDVQYSLNRIIHQGALDGRTSPRRSLLEPASEVIVADDHTVRIKTRYPWPNQPLNDRRVRQALDYAVDRKAIVRYKLQGHGRVLPTVLLPDAFGYAPRLQPYPYDLSVARQLLKAAAYPDDRAVTIYCNHEDLIFADGIALFLTKLVSIHSSHHGLSPGPYQKLVVLRDLAKTIRQVLIDRPS